MSTETPAVQVWRGETWAALALLAGLLCVALSVAWPAISNGQSSWSDEKAVAYQEASAKVHELSMQAGSTAPENQSRTMHEQLAEAQSKYAALRTQLESVRSQPARIALVLRYTGLALLVGGVIALVKSAGKNTAEP
jgi:hypothetical protein